MEPLTSPEQGKLRKDGTEGAQAAAWVWLFATLAVLIALGVAWGLTRSTWLRAPDFGSPLPSLPGKTPQPVTP